MNFRAWIRNAAITLILCLPLVPAVSAQPTHSTGRTSRCQVEQLALPVCFIKNRGVYPDDVRFFLRASGKRFYFTRHGMTTRLLGDTQDWVVRHEPIDPSLAVGPVGECEQQIRFHYYIGARANWRTNLRAYERILYRNLWPGIDQEYCLDGDSLKYEYIVHPGADPARIRVAIRGAEGVVLRDDGTLVIRTPNGILTDAAPVAWQLAGERRIPVEVRFAVRRAASATGHEVSFHLGQYDPSQPLVIDPAVIVYCGYVGGFEDDRIHAVAVDTQGQAYVTGNTTSDEQSFPLRGGPFLKHANTIHPDAFVAKVSSDGTRFIYCGYIGGLMEDYGEAIAADTTGNAYVTGRTRSNESTFPVLVGPDTTYNGSGDAFVAKIDPWGKLVYCGYVGGQGEDRGEDVAVDASGAAYLTGEAQSLESTFPVKVGPDLTFNGMGSNAGDAFVAKVNVSGTSLDYCGYIGGKGSDRAGCIAVDGQGRAVVGGHTEFSGSTFPTVVGPSITYNVGGNAFVARVSRDGGRLEYCGYIGGKLGATSIGDVAASLSGAAYVIGGTNCLEHDFPLKVGPSLRAAGKADAFVAKVNLAGTGFDYCGYLGGADFDSGIGIAVDASGAAYVGGVTQSNESSFPVVAGPDLTRNPQSPLDADAYVAKLDPSGARLHYCGYIGGAYSTSLNDVAIDPAGNLYAVGVTFNTQKSFPVKVGPLIQWMGKIDGWIAKVSHTLIDGPPTAKIGSTFNLGLKSSDSAGLVYQVGSSLGKGPIPIDQRKLGLTPDELLRISTNNVWPTIFQSYAGPLDGSGESTARVNVPNLPPLVGVSIFSAFVTVDVSSPSSLRSISDTARTQLIP